MRSAHVAHAAELQIACIFREIARREFAEFWRELARPVTFFDLCSPHDLHVDRNRRIL
jgi:hypothetical protein